MPKQPAERRRKRWDPTSVPIWALLLLRTSPVLLTGLAVLVLWGANR
jgi:hypothetical protein